MFNIIKPITNTLIRSQKKCFFVFCEILDVGGMCPVVLWVRIVLPRITICHHTAEKYYKRTFFKGNDTRKLIVGRFLNCLIVILFFFIRTRKNRRVDKKITALVSNNV